MSLHLSVSAQLPNPSISDPVLLCQLLMVIAVELCLYMGVSDRTDNTLRFGDVDGGASYHLSETVEVIDTNHLRDVPVYPF